MDANFEAINAAVDFVAQEVDAVIQIIQNPNVNNNDQQAIDALTARLSGIGNALKAALPVEPTPEPAPVEERAPVEETPADTTDEAASE